MIPYILRPKNNLLLRVQYDRGPSMMKDFEMALGQYIFYRDLIQLGQDEYQEIYLAIKDKIYKTFFNENLSKLLLNDTNWIY